MDSFSDSGELYVLKNQFYTNQHQKVLSHSLELYSKDNQLKVLTYQIRSTIALGKDASNIIESGKTRFEGNEPLFQLLSAWDDLKSFGTDDSTYFDDLKRGENELQTVLSALYFVKFRKDIDQAITFLTEYIDNSSYLKFDELEPFLVLVQLYLIKGNFKEANKILLNFKNFPDAARDGIIYQVLESWLLSLRGESDNINNAYYFYDELLSSDFDNDPQGKFKILSVLFVLTLQLRHYPEAQELLAQISELSQGADATLIANKITFDYIANGGSHVDELLGELKQIDQEHAMLNDYLEKNSKFDEVVAKYNVSA